jgi:hypothetical protein
MERASLALEKCGQKVTVTDLADVFTPWLVITAVL